MKLKKLSSVNFEVLEDKTMKNISGGDGTITFETCDSSGNPIGQDTVTYPGGGGGGGGMSSDGSVSIEFN